MRHAPDLKCQLPGQDLSNFINWEKGQCSATPWTQSPQGLVRERTCVEGKFTDYQKLIVSGDVQRDYSINVTLAVTGSGRPISHSFTLYYSFLNGKKCTPKPSRNTFLSGGN